MKIRGYLLVLLGCLGFVALVIVGTSLKPVKIETHQLIFVIAFICYAFYCGFDELSKVD